MAKKLNKLMQRVAALEKTVADFFAPKKTAKRKANKAKKAKSVKKAKKAKKGKAAKTTGRPRKAAARVVPAPQKPKPAKRSAAKKAVPAPVPGPVKKARKAARKTTRVAPPAPEKLSPSGEPNFTTPTSQA